MTRGLLMEHHLKILGPYWDAVRSGVKNFEVRRDDRGFAVDDVLVLSRITQVPGGAADEAYTREMKLRRRVIYILPGGQFGIEPGYVVLGLGPLLFNLT
jgi:hypothetical protein